MPKHNLQHVVALVVLRIQHISICVGVCGCVGVGVYLCVFLCVYGRVVGVGVDGVYVLFREKDVPAHG